MCAANVKVTVVKAADSAFCKCYIIPAMYIVLFFYSALLKCRNPPVIKTYKIVLFDKIRYAADSSFCTWASAKKMAPKRDIWPHLFLIFVKKNGLGSCFFGTCPHVTIPAMYMCFFHVSIPSFLLKVHSWADNTVNKQNFTCTASSQNTQIKLALCSRIKGTV